MSIAKKGEKNTYLKLSTGGENITFSPSFSQDFFSIALKNKIAIKLAAGFENLEVDNIIETFPNDAGANNLVDTGASDATYNANLESYSYTSGSSGLLSSVLLLETDQELDKVLITEVFGSTNYVPKSRIEISLNNGLNYSFTDLGTYRYVDELIDVSNLPLAEDDNPYQLKVKLYLDEAVVLPSGLNTWNTANNGTYGVVSQGTYQTHCFQSRSNYNLMWHNSRTSIDTGTNPRIIDELQDINLITGVPTLKSGLTTSQLAILSCMYVGKDFTQIYMGDGQQGSYTTSAFRRFTYLTDTWSSDTKPPNAGSLSNFNSHNGCAGGQNNGILYKGFGLNSYYKDAGSGAYNPNWASAIDDGVPGVETAWKYVNGTWSALTVITSGHRRAAGTSATSSTNVWMTYLGMSSPFVANSNDLNLYYWNGTTWSTKAVSLSGDNQGREGSRGLTGNSNNLYQTYTTGNLSTKNMSNYSKSTNTWTSLASFAGVTGGSYDAEYFNIGFTPGNVWMNAYGYGGAGNAFLNSGLQYKISNFAGLRAFGVRVIYK